MSGGMIQLMIDGCGDGVDLMQPVIKRIAECRAVSTIWSGAGNVAPDRTAIFSNRTAKRKGGSKEGLYNSSR